MGESSRVLYKDEDKSGKHTLSEKEMLPLSLYRKEFIQALTDLRLTEVKTQS